MKVPIWVDARAASAIHARLLMRHGGTSGAPDEGRLESAFALPRQQVSSLDTIEIATAYITGIIQNHPFVDGNRCTGFVVGVLFLELNGFDFTASEAEAAQAVLELATGTVDETGFALFLRDHSKRARKRK